MGLRRLPGGLASLVRRHLDAEDDEGARDVEGTLFAVHRRYQRGTLYGKPKGGRA